ncbi:hypothetical protein ACO22_00961 [Paracoccidioides brasiliensis]|uniref:Uncharacterized protein n=1 Tax=Paracoccidioides brasiliensis TaxID=121759 RepID=A0A1D2JN76_PARBR|nr:hypothetical protein ACO22_00961 [Paracoccidioides brasiliensis]
MSCHINDAIFSKINHRTNLPRDNYSPLTVRLRPFINRAIWDDIHTQRTDVIGFLGYSFVEYLVIPAGVLKYTGVKKVGFHGDSLQGSGAH